MKNRFPEYQPEKKNEMVIVIADKTIHDEKTNKDVVEVLKDMNDVNTFFDKLQGLCKQHGFEIDASGTKAQMIEGFYKKLGDPSMTLLSKYADHVRQCEGIDFISRINQPESDVIFTEEEKNKLLNIGK